MFLRVLFLAYPNALSAFPSLFVITAALLLSGCSPLVTLSGNIPVSNSQVDASALQQLYQRAHDDHAQAQYELARRLDTGDHIRMAPEEAVAWLRKAALQQHTEAQFLLGMMYLNGRGVEYDPVIAADWFLEASLQGHAMAQYHLGNIHATGIGVERDSERGLYWLRSAANLGLAIAQHSMGLQLLGVGTTSTEQDEGAAWIYRAGLTYLDKERPISANTALLDMEQALPGHSLVTELRARLVLNNNLSPDNSPYRWDGNSLGTGWTLRSGYVVTNYHVIADSDDITLINSHGEQLAARVMLCDKQRDIALLAVADPSLLPPALPLARQGATTGDGVFTLGFPQIDVLGDTPKLTAGKVLGERWRFGTRDSYKLNLQIFQGNSGGPLVNMHGEVVGIMTSLLGRVAADGSLEPVPARSFAVKSDHLQAMLSGLPILDTTHTELPYRADKLDGLAQRIQQSVLIVAARMGRPAISSKL